jgi:hypothetical protein
MTSKPTIEDIEAIDVISCDERMAVTVEKTISRKSASIKINVYLYAGTYISVNMPTHKVSKTEATFSVESSTKIGEYFGRFKIATNEKTCGIFHRSPSKIEFKSIGNAELEETKISLTYKV